MRFEIITALFQNSSIIIKYILVFLLGLAPISEVRGAIIFGISSGLNPVAVFFIGLIANILIIPVIFYVLTLARFNDLALKLFGKRTINKIDKNKERFEVYEEIALLLFVAIPLPMTGAWTAALIAHILKFDKLKSIIVISIGATIAGIIVFLSTIGVFSLL